MRDLLALGAGLLVAAGGLIAFVELPRLPSPDRFAPAGDARRWLLDSLERAGWPQAPERFAVFELVLDASLCCGFGAVTPLLAPLGIAVALAVSLLGLNRAIARRRRRLAGELVPLLELFTLELSGGGSALSALGSVTMQVDSELATDLRGMLISAQVAGSASFEARLLDYSERIRLPALASLATVLTASREFGTGATLGVRALATDLRRSQRRELIEQSRRALNHVLLPAAVCVLLPFLSVLMFPAVTVLQRSLR